MSNLVFAFGNELTGETKAGGGNFPKLGHAYVAEITTITDENNWVNINIKGLDFTAGQYDSFSISRNSPFIIEFIEKIANNVIASNESMKGAAGQSSLDISKWVDKGLKIGVVYGIQQEKSDGGAYVDSKWVSPKFSIPVEQVEGWDPDVTAYEAHQKEFWSDGATAAPAANQAPVVGDINIDDSLPF